MKDLGELHYFLGIEVWRSEDGLHLTQQRYVHELLEKAHMCDSKLVPMPLAPGKIPSKSDGEPLHDAGLYMSLVGTMNKLCQSLQYPNYSHGLLKRLIRSWGNYKICHFLHKVSPLQLIAYPNVDLVGCLDDSNSTSGWCIFLGLSLVSMSSSKHKVTFRSSTIVFHALVLALCKVEWYKGFWRN